MSEDPGENREFPLSAFKRFFIQFTKAFPDIHVEVAETISEGDASIMVVLKKTLLTLEQAPGCRVWLM